MRDEKNNIYFHVEDLEPKTEHLVYNLAKHPAVEGPVAIMPDAHPDPSGAVVGFTAHFTDAVVPQIVGGDIGCGIATYPLQVKVGDLEHFDLVLREKVPIGSRVHEKAPKTEMEKARKEALAGVDEFYKMCKPREVPRSDLALGTLGGGNHFIELDADEQGQVYATVHSGSRLLGQRISGYFKMKARDYCFGYKIQVLDGFEYLPLENGGEDYLQFLRVGQEYARLNRLIVLEQMASVVGAKFDPALVIESSHNYVDEFKVVRKGAVSARLGQKVIVALNMAEGIIIGTGLGNAEFNDSAPHGLGRKFSRSQMNNQLVSGEMSMEIFRSTMRGIYSTSVRENTISESPQAYKDFGAVKKYLERTVAAQKILRPIYNLKA